MRSVRSEALSIMMVLAVPALIATVFPYSALQFKAAERGADAGRFKAAFVQLSEEGERAAMRTVRTALGGGRANDRYARADLSLSELTDDAGGRQVMTLADRVRRQAPAAVPCGVSPYLPSMEAPPARRIVAEEQDAARPVFSREELLEMK